MHKLWISGRRPVAEQTKSAKDLRQAEALLEVLAEDRPGDLLIAWDALSGDAAAAELVRGAMRRIDPVVQERLAGLLSL